MKIDMILFVVIGCGIVLTGCSDLTILSVEPIITNETTHVLVNIKNTGQRGTDGTFNTTIEAQKRTLDTQNNRLTSQLMLLLSKKVNNLEARENLTLDFEFPNISTTLYNRKAIRKILLKVDPDNRIKEWSDMNNSAMSCVSRKVPDRVCWLQDKCLINMNDLDLIVRTVNFHGIGIHYPKRVKGISEKFYNDWPSNIGLIGMQEVRDTMRRCPGFNISDTIAGVKCFAKIIGKKFDSSYTWAKSGPLGIVTSSNWIKLSSKSWVLGKDSMRHFGNRATRYLLEVKLRHKTHDWILRFYTTHLSHGDQESQRNEQIDNLNAIISNRILAGELPPIVVGDFNFRPHTESSSNSRMNDNFSLANLQAVGCDEGKPTKTKIDHVWIGKKESFPNTVGHYMPIRFITTTGKDNGIDLKSNYTVGDYTGELSDHNSPGFGFKVMGALRRIQ